MKPDKDVDAYLAKLSSAERATLEKVRKEIHTAAPSAEEGMSCGMPSFIPRVAHLPRPLPSPPRGCASIH
jgi:uncharacterized protein YdhG (YjbR/CyaY superfamily)